jgi:hypothetical protein
MKKKLLKLPFCIFLALLFTTTQVIAQLNFAPAVNYTVGRSPYSVTSADFNGDGKMDLASANHVSNTASVLLGSGTGTLGTQLSLDIGTATNPRSVFSADFNNDGKMDLITANHTTNGLTLFKGSGTGTFPTRGGLSIYSGAGPVSVFSADFNNDGNMDVVTANGSGKNLSVFLGKGTYSFEARVDYAIGILSPTSVFSADFNADGNADLAVATSNNRVQVLLGTGTGTFGPATSYTTASNPRSVHAADFNGDGKPDLVTANSGTTSNNVSVFLNSGSGTFAAAVNYSIGASTDPYSVIAADFDGDGKLDLATANFSGNNISVLLGSGTGTFAAPVNYAVGTKPYAVTAADFDGDGRVDLAAANSVANPTIGEVSVLLNTTVGTTLPLNLISFSGSRSNDVNKLQWQTESEINTNHFILERSNDGRSFTAIATVNAKGSGANSYYYNDAVKQNGKIFYRLKMIDNDGRFTYSSIVILTDYTNNTLTINPNPVKDFTSITINQNLINTKATLTDAMGKVIQRITLAHTTTSINLSAYPAGMYFLQLQNGETIKLIKQ